VTFSIFDVGALFTEVYRARTGYEHGDTCVLCRLLVELRTRYFRFIVLSEGCRGRSGVFPVGRGNPSCTVF